MTLLKIRRGIRKHHVAISIACIASLLLLSTWVAFFPLPGLDVRWAQRIQEISSPIARSILIGVTLIGNPFPMAIATSVLLIGLLFTPLRSLARPLSLVIPADAFSFLWKFVIDRPRPSLPFVEVLQTFPDPSFPSMRVVHSIVFFGFLGAVCVHQWIYLKKQWLLVLATALFSLAAMMPVSRIFVGAHWPTDVLGGLLLGGAFFTAQLQLYSSQQILHRARRH